MRPFVTVTALALALLPAAAFAQNPPAQQPPATPPAAQTPAAPAQPAAPKLTIASPAAMLLVQIKPDQTAVFEEMVAKLKAGLAATQDATLKQRPQGSRSTSRPSRAGRMRSTSFRSNRPCRMPSTNCSSC